MAIPQCPHLSPIKNYQKAQKQVVFAVGYPAKSLNALNLHILAKIHKVDLQIIFNHFPLIKANLIKTVEGPCTTFKSIHQYLLIFLHFLWVLVNKWSLIGAICNFITSLSESK